MAAVTASTKNVVGEISKSHLMSQASLYNPSNHLHNSLLMNMSINPLHLGPITGMPFPPNSAFFLDNNNDESKVADMSRRRRSLSERSEEPCYKMSRDTEDESAGEEGISGSSSGAENGSAKQAAQRNQKRPIPSEQKDGKYYERRRRNNLAAKKSRDARKTREDQLVMRVAHLEKENAIFRAQVAILREEMSVLQLFLCQKINLGAQSTAAEKSSI